VTICKIDHPAGGIHPLYFLADAPHLVKNLRAALSKHKIYLPAEVVKENNLPTDVVSIDDIKKLTKFQEDMSLKPAPFLSESDLAPTHFNKMDVGSALRVFCNQVAAALRYLANKKEYPKTLLTTAWFLESVRRWFDLMTSRCPKLSLSKFRQDKYDESIAFLNSFKTLFLTIKIGESGKWVPIQTGIVLTTTAILEIQVRLFADGFEFILTARFSQDKLENLFSQLRRRRPTPTAYEFENALKIVTISQFLYQVRGGSYEEDDAHYIADFFSKNPTAKANFEEQEVEENFLSDLMENCDPADAQKIEKDVLYNLVGYVIHSIQKTGQLQCQVCIRFIVSNQKEIDDHGFGDLVKLRDYTGESLVYCSKLVFEEIFVPMEEMFLKLETSTEFLTTKNITEQLKSHAMEMLKDILPECCDLKKKLVSRFVRLRIKISAKKFTKIKRAEVKSKNSGGEKGSRSMAMKKAVEEMK